ncbi:uncharacterized protein LOC143282004 [Babylonia areolata]|uniref:uncharacterized protein LOC143282004 n=1 Tax=Babylonia areolata TaxID=304850 RepID=UPI003FD08D8E
MPNYVGSILLANETVYPEGCIEGEVRYTPSKRCTLKNVELFLVCRAFYYHKENRKKKYLLDQSPIRIPLLHSDGRATVQNDVSLTQVNKPEVFRFKAELPPDLLPSSDQDNRRVLDIAYTLELSSKRGWFGSMKRDAATGVTVLAVMDLSGDPFSKMDIGKVAAVDAQFGQGLDILASAHLPSFGWQTKDKIPVLLDLARMSSTKTHSATATLERTIKYRDKDTTTNITSSQSTSISEKSDARVHRKLEVEIPEFTPLSGVMFNSVLSIQYRVQVEIKSTDNSLPTLVLSLPIVIGTRRHPREDSNKEESKPDLLKGPESTESRSRPSVVRYVSREGSSAHPSPNTSRSSTQHFHSACDLGTSCTSRGSQTSQVRAEAAGVSHGSAERQAHPRTNPQRMQTSASDADSGSGLHVVNPSSRGSGSTPRDQTLPSRLPDLSFRSSGPAAMNASGQGLRHQSPPGQWRPSGDHHTTYRKQSAHAATHQRATGYWEVPDGRYEDPRPGPGNQRPRYGAMEDFYDTGVTNFVAENMSYGEANQSYDQEPGSSDTDPLVASKKRRR